MKVVFQTLVGRRSLVASDHVFAQARRQRSCQRASIKQTNNDHQIGRGRDSLSSDLSFATSLGIVRKLVAQRRQLLTEIIHKLFVAFFLLRLDGLET